LATDRELGEVTGLTKGAVPPLGVLFGLRTICDRSLLAVDVVNFNAGTQTDSIAMPRGELIRIGGGEVATFSAP
jgi:prolyl-tRNA editing enzyme YbaK/EbsC (Cys-tRNA(Pro) deacylase)